MDCNDLSVEIWGICILHDVHISAAHIPGKHNIIADTASRKFNDVVEWMLDPPMFQKLCSLFSVPDIDMFETRLNKQLDQYVSWLPDPGSVSIDAMATCWSNHYIYIFPPFSMFWPVIKKIQLEAQKALVIAPIWPTQTWFPKLLQMAVDKPLLISSCNLRLPGTSLKRPLYPKLRLMAVLCSNSSQLQLQFQQTLQKSYQQHGEKGQQSSMSRQSRNSLTFVVKEKLLQIKQMTR